MFTFYVDPAAMQPEPGASPFAQRSALTLGIFFVMAFYYLVYYGGVLWKSRALRATP